MSNRVIKVDNLSKKYVIGHRQEQGYATLRDAMATSIKRFGSRLLHPLDSSSVMADDNYEEFWALRNVSFEVDQGEVIGIVGRNGAGKSTLLKILSRITEPSSGQVRIKGRLASLLEVGTGFHPELTGRENIFLNGAVLGMTKAEIKNKFDEIVAFAEVEKFLDTPVKRYSSGMYVRLAFAVAAHLEPEILIIDEVLAVGDAQFQKKCLGKMEESGKQGRTILFVSHNMTAVKTLCQRVVWLENGTVMDCGATTEIVSRYLQEASAISLNKEWADPQTAPGNEHVRLMRVNIASSPDELSGEITVRTPIDLEFDCWNFEENAQLNLSIVVYDLEGTCVLNSISESKSYPVGLVRGVCHIPSDFLNDMTYRVRMLIVKDTSIPLLDIDNVGTFEVHDVEREGNWYGKQIGIVRPRLEWTTAWLGDAFNDAAQVPALSEV